MMPAVVLPVMAILNAPQLLAISLVLLIVRIGSKLLLLPQHLACALAILVVAKVLVFDARIVVEGRTAMGTTSWISHDFLPRKP
jgi:hypothetical protein